MAHPLDRAAITHSTIRTSNNPARKLRGNVTGNVEETLNALLDAEADRLCNAQRNGRRAYRGAPRYARSERKLPTKAGEVKLRIPKLRTRTFETAIIEPALHKIVRPT